jgi:hypothetical protein
MDKKKLLILLAIVVIIIAIVMVKSNNSNKEDNLEAEKIELSDIDYVVTDDGTKVNNSETLKSEKNLNGLKISNIQLTTDSDGKTTLLADVENTTSSATTTKFVKISILDKSGTVLAEVDGMIVALESGETTQLNVGTSADYANAYDFEIEED